MQQFNGMNFVSKKPKTCIHQLKVNSNIYMAKAIKFVDPEPVLPICKEYHIR